jgi:catechol 2,3-dioxygenase-like lactoylglutathione lyase family enzyme
VQSAIRAHAAICCLLLVCACEPQRIATPAAGVDAARADPSAAEQAPSPDGVRGFRDVSLFASNVAELREFYAKLGFPQVVDEADELAVFLVGDQELAIHTSADRPRAAVALSFLVMDTGLIQERLTELGIGFDGPQPLRPGLAGIALKDPNENTLEFLSAQ